MAETTELSLNSDNVWKVFFDSMFTDEEVKDLKKDEAPEGAVLAEGIIVKAGFHPERLQKNKPAIRSLLSQLPETFLHDKGGGHSFLNACYTKDGVLWGNHQVMEFLFLLGLATKMVKLCAARELWESLPGGMPYYMVNLDEFKPS